MWVPLSLLLLNGSVRGVTFKVPSPAVPVPELVPISLPLYMLTISKPNQHNAQAKRRLFQNDARIEMPPLHILRPALRVKVCHK